MSVSDITAIAVWAAPTIVVIIVAIVSCVHYFKSHELNVANALAVANALLKNEKIKSIVENSIELARLTWKSSDYCNKILVNILDVVKGNIIIELNHILYSPETDADREIAKVFEEYDIITDDVAGISASILSLMGYDDGKIRNILIESLDDDDEEKEE